MALAMVSVLAACSGDEGGATLSGRSVSVSTGAFDINAADMRQLIEGNQGGVNIPVAINRIDGHDSEIEFSISGIDDSDNRRIDAQVWPSKVNGFENNVTVNIRLAIDDLPIKPHQRRFRLVATDGADKAETTITLNVEPVNAPDVYLLVGQSNMVGFSGDGTKLSDIGGPDEPHPRIFQLNVTKNDQFELFKTASDFRSKTKNVVNAKKIIQAEDPLHVPVDPDNETSKDRSYIGMGLSFAKAALNDTTQNIVLVPAAWSGSAFCDNFDGPIGQWNPERSANNAFGNTWLFDRAVTRTNIALEETGGILRGILWHQGESDSNDRCAGEYLNNLQRMAEAFRTNIAADARGQEGRRKDTNIPFVTGTMSRGIDERGDLSDFHSDKQQIDDAHRSITSRVAFSEVALADDLVPANGFPCGNQDCIHFGALALRELGKRYYQSLLRAAKQP